MSRGWKSPISLCRFIAMSQAFAALSSSGVGVGSVGFSMRASQVACCPFKAYRRMSLGCCLSSVVAREIYLRTVNIWLPTIAILGSTRHPCNEYHCFIFPVCTDVLTWPILLEPFGFSFFVPAAIARMDIFANRRNEISPDLRTKMESAPFTTDEVSR